MNLSEKFISVSKQIVSKLASRKAFTKIEDKKLPYAMTIEHPQTHATNYYRINAEVSTNNPDTIHIFIYAIGDWYTASFKKFPGLKLYIAAMNDILSFVNPIYDNPDYEIDIAEFVNRVIKKYGFKRTLGKTKVLKMSGKKKIIPLNEEERIGRVLKASADGKIILTIKQRKVLMKRKEQL